jgi:hypothetical protein
VTWPIYHVVKIFSEFGDKSVRILTSQFKDILQKQCVDTGAIDVECKTNTLPILMHQMRISTTKVTSVMLRSKKLKIRKKGEN